MKRTLIALNPPRRVHDFLMHARVIAARLSEDPRFSPPPPSLVAFEADVAALEAALIASASRASGSANARKACQAKVALGLQILQAYVQSMANASTADDAALLIELAGMSVKNALGPSKQAFVVKRGPTADSAHAYARARRTRASYEWQMSTDGERWVSVPSTVRADAAFHGLEALTLYWFRYRTVTREGTSDWSDAVSFRAG